MLKLEKSIRTIPEESGNLGAMIRSVRKSKGGDGVFCVVRSDATQGMMEIVPLLYARLEAKSRDIAVLGLAGSKKNALELVRQMVDEMAKRGEFAGAKPLGADEPYTEKELYEATK
ncbi:MAG: hypothetical protein J6Y10_10945 [Lachnospiraceae bacterium]|nr:hypothetical protein [Lachnospiraceae bacterium]